MRNIILVSNSVVSTSNLKVKSDIFSLYNPIHYIGNRRNCIYLIDVHYVWSKENDKLQDQRGVDYYRNLLQTIGDNVKVIFYSPIEKKELVRLKPENYVLKLLPFLKCEYDGSFESCLEDILLKYENSNWPMLNSASENLLSGWSMLDGEEITVRGEKNKQLFIDDEYDHWRLVYRTIFRNPDNKLIELDFSREDFFRDWSTVMEKIIEVSKKARFITSDFYLTESHEKTRYFKELKDVTGISGYKILTSIMKKTPWKPYMMYTSSNKIWNFEVFQANGVWSWSVKDLRASAPASQKKAQYRSFKDNIEKLYDPFWLDVQSIWEGWEKIKLIKKGNLKRYEERLIEDCLHRLRNEKMNSLRSKDKFETTDYSSNHVFAGICISLSGLLENKRGNNNYTSTLYLVRSFFAHGTNYHIASEEDAIIALIIAIDFLGDVNSEYEKTKILNRPNSKCQNILHYIQLLMVIENRRNVNALLLKYLKKIISKEKLLDTVKANLENQLRWESEKLNPILKYIQECKS